MKQRALTHGRTAAQKLRAASWTVRLCVCASLASCGRAQWREADANLNAAAAAARADGFEPMNGQHNTFGAFTDSGSTTWRVHLTPRQPYFVAAACTAGCDALDFTIVDSDATEAFADTSAGAAPRLLFTPAQGNLRITFRHDRCIGGRCRWIAQVYARPTAPH